MCVSFTDASGFLRMLWRCCQLFGKIRLSFTRFFCIFICWTAFPVVFHWSLKRPRGQLHLSEWAPTCSISRQSEKRTLFSWLTSLWLTSSRLTFKLIRIGLNRDEIWWDSIHSYHVVRCNCCAGKSDTLPLEFFMLTWIWNMNFVEEIQCCTVT